MNEEIFGGLKSAVERGESLQKAMMTFYRAGYKKEEIEEAAKYLSQIPIEPVLSSSQISVNSASGIAKPKFGFFGNLFKKKEFGGEIISPKKLPSPTPIPAPKPLVSKMVTSPIVQEKIVNNSSQVNQIVSSYGEQPVIKTPPQVIQKAEKKVSDYGTDKPKDKFVIVILVSILVLLFGLLISIFLFKDGIINFLSNLFS